MNGNNITVSPQICNNDILKLADNINALSGALALLGPANDNDAITQLAAAATRTPLVAT